QGSREGQERPNHECRNPAQTQRNPQTPLPGRIGLPTAHCGTSHHPQAPAHRRRKTSHRDGKTLLRQARIPRRPYATCRRIQNRKCRLRGRISECDDLITLLWVTRTGAETHTDVCAKASYRLLAFTKNE